MFLLTKRFATVLLLLSCSLAHGSEVATNDSASWSFRDWQTEDGLPDNSVTSVGQTPDGFLWVATYGGLMRFDGASFSTIPLPSLFKKSVRAMLLDHLGHFWLGMDSGSVVFLDEKKTRSFGNADGLPPERIAVMAEDREGAIWIFYSTTLCRIKNGQISRFIGTEDLPVGVNPWLTTDAHGEVWFSKGGQVGVFREGKLQRKISFNETAIRLCGAKSSGLWLCVGPRLLKYEENHEPVDIARLPNNIEPQVIFEDKTGALWIGTVADGLYRVKGGVLEKIPTSQQSVNCVSEDREGNIWVGTRGGGLNLIRASAVKMIGRDTGLPFESVASVCQDTEGVMWVASQSGVLSKFQNGKWQVIGADAGWTNDAATCVVADKKGGVWVGARNRTLNYFCNGIWRTWQRADNLHGGSVHLIFVAANDDVWVVTGSPSRLQRLRDGKLAEPLVLPGESRTIRAMAESLDGTLWIGTLEGQVLRVNNSSLIVETNVVERSGSAVRVLETTGDGSLLIGYAGAGIGRLKGGKFSLVTSANGLRDDFASQLLLDNYGDVWVVGNRGLFKVALTELADVADGRAEKLRSQIFGRDEGLPNYQPNFANFPNVCKDDAGHLWFALRSGLLLVQPGNISANPVPPPVVVEQVSVDDQPAAVYDSGSPLQTDSGNGLPDLRRTNVVLHVAPGQRKLEFEFAALSFASPGNVQFRYRLENFDEKWTEVRTPERNAKYPHLAAGKYRFHVLACNNAGTWNDSGAMVTVVVEPYFWQQWWFRAVVLMVFTISVVAIVRYVSFRRLRARMEVLEQQAAIERERTRIARDMHDEIGAKLTRLSLLSEMAGVNPAMPDSARSDVKEISETARETIRSFEEVVWAVNPRNDKLADLVHYLCRYAEDYFEGSALQCVIDLPPKIPAVVLPTEVRRQVFLAAKEALNNTLKHAKASRVRLQLACGADDFKISISDDGCGFDSASPPRRSGGGNGLENMRVRLHSIGGRFEYCSRPGGGTQIDLIAPAK